MAASGGDAEPLACTKYTADRNCVMAVVLSPAQPSLLAASVVDGYGKKGQSFVLVDTEAPPDAPSRGTFLGTDGFHPPQVLSLAFHPTQADLLASGSVDDTVCLWNWKTGGLRIAGACTGVFKGHTDAVVSVAFDPTQPGGMLASGSCDNTIRLWDATPAAAADEGVCVATLQGHTDSVDSVAFHPIEPGVLASGSADSTIRLWDTITHACINTLEGHTASVSCVAFHPTRPNVLASASEDETIRVWGTDTGVTIDTLQGHTDIVNSVAFHPRRPDVLASASDDKSIRLWNIAETRAATTNAILRGHTDRVASVAFHPSQIGVLASASGDNTVRVWALPAGLDVRLPRREFRHPTMHGWCSEQQRACVLAVLVVELRVDQQADTPEVVPGALPSLAHDLWLLVLEFVRRSDLGCSE